MSSANTDNKYKRKLLPLNIHKDKITHFIFLDVTAKHLDL
jgi:hypothetical protein